MLWLVALVVWVIGLYAASDRCWSLADDLPTEGMGVQTREHGLCEVTDVDDTVIERYDRDEWDFTEIALVLAGAGAGVLLGGVPRKEEHSCPHLLEP